MFKLNYNATFIITPTKASPFSRLYEYTYIFISGWNKFAKQIIFLIYVGGEEAEQQSILNSMRFL